VAPVIRISDDVFRRLQRLSEPLVDTPSSVIERVLEHFEKSQTRPTAQATLPRVMEQRQPEVAGDAPRFGLYLVPATKENLLISIRRPVSLDIAKEVLADGQFQSLAEAIAPAKEFRCWATTDANKAVFDSMRPGDLVLLTEKATGRFNYRARIRAKLVSEDLARRLWPVVPGLPWKFIYILDDLQPLNVRKDCLVTALGYESSFWVPGHIKVSPERLRAAIQQHGSFEKLVDDCKA
jgi:hypothetical protein